VPTERPAVYWHKAGKLEALILLASAPFLLFPERIPFLTTLALLLVAAVWLAPILLIRSPLIPPTPFNLVLLLLCLMILVGIVVTADPVVTLPKATGLILGLSVWRFLVLGINDRTQLGWATAGYIAAGAAFVLVGVLSADWLLKDTAQVPFVQSLLPGGDYRPVLAIGGFSIHPNQLAGTITLLLPLLISLLVDAPYKQSANRRLIRGGLLLTAVALGLALLLTQSRGGWFGAAGGLGVLLLLWSLLLAPSPARRWLRIGLGLAGIGAVIFLLVVGPQALTELWLAPPQETAVGSLVTLTFRRELWPWAATAIADFPFTGTGLGSFRNVAVRLYPAPIPPDFDLGHAHNVFLQVALDIGLPGLTAYLALIMASFAVGWQVAKRDRQLRGLSLGLLASLAAFHLFGLADTIALGAKPAVLFWGIIGLLSALPRLSK
jgi:putative inorganic carbon (HCO3(-)) transporter